MKYVGCSNQKNECTDNQNDLSLTAENLAADNLHWLPSNN